MASAARPADGFEYAVLNVLRDSRMVDLGGSEAYKLIRNTVMAPQQPYAGSKSSLVMTTVPDSEDSSANHSDGSTRVDKVEKNVRVVGN